MVRKMPASPPSALAARARSRIRVPLPTPAPTYGASPERYVTSFIRHSPEVRVPRPRRADPEAALLDGDNQAAREEPGQAFAHGRRPDPGLLGQLTYVKA